MSLHELHPEMPATVTLILAALRPATIVEIANDISDELHELQKLSPAPNIPSTDWVRVCKEREAFRSLYNVLRNYIELSNGEPYLSEIRSPEGE